MILLLFLAIITTAKIHLSSHITNTWHINFSLFSLYLPYFQSFTHPYCSQILLSTSKITWKSIFYKKSPYKRSGIDLLTAYKIHVYPLTYCYICIFYTYPIPYSPSIQHQYTPFTAFFILSLFLIHSIDSL